MIARLMLFLAVVLTVAIVLGGACEREPAGRELEPLEPAAADAARVELVDAGAVDLCGGGGGGRCQCCSYREVGPHGEVILCDLPAEWIEPCAACLRFYDSAGDAGATAPCEPPPGARAGELARQAA